jgi:hypothetical protein
MTQTKFLFTIIPLGTATILSYIFGLGGNADAMWGGVPEKFRGLYTVSMVVSALSYFVFTAYILLNIFSDKISVPGIDIKNALYISYIVMLASSALWIPLVNMMLSNPSSLVWFAIRASLALVALGTLSILIMLLKVPSDDRGFFYYASIVGVSWYLFHTGILDALIWPYLWNK